MVHHALLPLPPVLSFPSHTSYHHTLSLRAPVIISVSSTWINGAILLYYCAELLRIAYMLLFCDEWTRIFFPGNLGRSTEFLAKFLCKLVHCYTSLHQATFKFPFMDSAFPFKALNFFAQLTQFCFQSCCLWEEEFKRRANIMCRTSHAEVWARVMLPPPPSSFFKVKTVHFFWNKSALFDKLSKTCLNKGWSKFLSTFLWSQ